MSKAGSGNYESYAYTYDAVGNLTIQTTNIFTSGTQTSTSGRTFVYDAIGRLTQVTDPNVEPGSENRIAQYKYNGLGFRIMTQTDADGDETFEDGERTSFMYDDRWRRVGSFVDSGVRVLCDFQWKSRDCTSALAWSVGSVRMVRAMTWTTWPARSMVPVQMMSGAWRAALR